MAQQTPPVMLTTPSGKQVPMPLTKAEPGTARQHQGGRTGPVPPPDGVLSTVTAAGPLNPKEVADMRATTELLGPVAGAITGGVALAEDRGAATPIASPLSRKSAAAAVAPALLLIALLLAWRLEALSVPLRQIVNGKHSILPELSSRSPFWRGS